MRNTSTYCSRQKLPLQGVGGLLFYHPDHLGSSSFITDVNGEAYQHYEYMPYGELFVEQKGGTDQYTPYLFNGKELDDKTGLYYYGARYLDPKTSIWLSVDPLMDDYPDISSYMYCMGKPIISIDTDGRKVGMYFAKTTVGAGLTVGASAAMYRGTAFDDYGVTHFTLINTAVPENLDDNPNPDIVMGASGYLGGIGGSFDGKSKSFKQAIEKWGFAISGGALVTGGLGYTATSENSIDGVNAEIGFGGFGAKVGASGGGNVHFVESISVSHGQAERIGVNNRWFVDEKKAICDKNSNVTGYSGTIYKKNFWGKVSNTGVQVQSGVVTDKNGTSQSNNVWESRQYKLEQNIEK